MNWKLMVVLLMVPMMLLTQGTTVSADELDADCPICDFDYSTYTGPLAEPEVDGLLLALNDEYHAWAVYDQVIIDFGAVRPFTSIQKAEAKHIAALTRLFEAYEVPVPDNPWSGNVASFDSVSEACAAGVAAEIANADLYDELFSSTEREDILRVYRSLQRASEENHLPAFQKCADSDSRGGGNGQGEGGRGRSRARP